MKIYIAGPMRGFPLFNFAIFFRAAMFLRSKGHEVINPAEQDMSLGFDPSNPDLSQSVLDMHECFEFDFQSILDVDAVAFLPGWDRSKGAKAEKLVAHFTGKKCYDLLIEGDEMRLLEQPPTWSPVLSWGISK